MEGLTNEVFAFYADRLLNMGFINAVAIGEFRGNRLNSIRDRDIVKQYWMPGDPMVCSIYTDDMEPAIWPKVSDRFFFRLISVLMFFC
jgi:hypothetical protein